MKKETVLRRRARKIIKKSKLSLEEKITNCDKAINFLERRDFADSHEICPFPRRGIYDKEYYRYGCCSCEYFFKGTKGFVCGCGLIEKGELTVDQAIDGLQIFKSEMKKYLEEQEGKSSKTFLKRLRDGRR